ncbi:MAG: formimidoylglutamate deiminase, partial [Sphingopyxis terrae]|nr:formimidoylglutamate deiminase [Sphingopyxis terrae]
LGQAGRGIATGAAADLVSLTAADPALAARRGDAILDSWIFGRGARLVDCVWRRGVQCVAGGRHVARAAIDARYRAAMQALLA